MTRRLIVNADDFGLTPGVSAGILSAHHHGIVTSTTLLATAAIDPEQLAALRDSGLGVGIHVNLTLGRPLSNGRSLVDADGRFVRDASHAAARADARDRRISIRIITSVCWRPSPTSCSRPRGAWGWPSAVRTPRRAPAR